MRVKTYLIWVSIGAVSMLLYDQLRNWLAKSRE